MTAPHRRPRDARAAARRATRPASAAPRSARATPLGASRPAHRPDRRADVGGPGPADRPTAARVREIVPVGSVVGLDDSAAVRAVATEVVQAGAALVGTSSFETLAALTADERARTGAVTVRLFGGVHEAGACTGPASLQAVTATRCDVALVAGWVVGDEVFVPSAGYDIRRGLLLAADRAYLVHEAPGHTPPGAWTRLGELAEFAGTVGPLAPPDAPFGHPVA